MGDDREPKVVAEYMSEFEANIVRNMLVSEGIPCEVSGGALAGLRAEAPGLVQLLVPASFEEQARNLLAEHDASSEKDQDVPDED